MMPFCSLIENINAASDEEQAIATLIQFFKTSNEAELSYVIKLATTAREKSVVSQKKLRQWLLEWLNIPDWLFQSCYKHVGQLNETLSLIVPNANASSLTLQEVYECLNQIGKLEDGAKKAQVIALWQNCNGQERQLINQWLTGQQIVTCDKMVFYNALARWSQQRVEWIQWQLAKDWDVQNIRLSQYLKQEQEDEAALPFSFNKIKRIQKLPNIDLEDYQVTYGYEGLRVQLVKIGQDVQLWQENGRLLTSHFPEIIALFEDEDDVIIEGIIKPMAEDKTDATKWLENRLKLKRLNKKTVAKYAVALHITDCLAFRGEDLRYKNRLERGHILKKILPEWQTPMVMDKALSITERDELIHRLKRGSVQNEHGLMLHHRLAPYYATADQTSLTINYFPKTISVTLLSAKQANRGKHQDFLDYTFGIEHEEQVVPIATIKSKEVSAFTDELNHYISQNKMEKFGPVITVKPGLIFALTYQKTLINKRRKCGIELTQPKIVMSYGAKHWANISTLSELKNS